MSYTNVILSQPPKSGGWIGRSQEGHLLVFLGTHSITTEPDTMSKVPGATREVATVDYVDLDDGQGGIIQWGARVDKIGIVNKLRGQRNAIMGRLVLGEAKQGMSAPFILEDHTPEDAARFTNVWLPANRAALAGEAAQTPQPQAQQAPQAQPQQQQYVSAPAGQATFPGQMIPAPASTPVPVPTPQPQYPPVPDASSPWAPQPQGQPQGQPQPAAAAAAAVPGMEQFSPEAFAAMQRMVASGQLPAFPAPAQ